MIKTQKVRGAPEVEGFLLRPSGPEGADPPLPPEPKNNRLDRTIDDLLEVVPQEGRDAKLRKGAASDLDGRDRRRSWFIPGRKNEAGRR